MNVCLVVLVENSQGIKTFEYFIEILLKTEFPKCICFQIIILPSYFGFQEFENHASWHPCILGKSKHKAKMQNSISGIK